MERKIKIIGLYIGLLFFISILLILITSLSNDKIVSRYPETQPVVATPVGLNTTMTDNNLKVLNNESTLILDKALKFYVLENKESAKECINKINREELSEEDKQIYDILINKLN